MMSSQIYSNDFLKVFVHEYLINKHYRNKRISWWKYQSINLPLFKIFFFFLVSFGGVVAKLQPMCSPLITGEGVNLLSFLILNKTIFKTQNNFFYKIASSSAFPRFHEKIHFRFLLTKKQLFSKLYFLDYVACMLNILVFI